MNKAAFSSDIKILDKRISFLNSSDDPQLVRIYDLYEDMFPLQEERETLEGLYTCLACNVREDLQEKFGGFEESWFYTSVADKIIGAINLFLCDFTDKNALQYGTGAAHINYIFVDPDYRKSGIANDLFNAVVGYVQKRWGKGAKFFMFCEQNLSSENALSFFNRKNFRSLDFPYVQPALNEEVGACNNLELRVKMPNDLEYLPKSVLQNFLYCFLGVSVGKGNFPETCLDWKNMQEFLKNNEQISFKERQ